MAERIGNNRELLVSTDVVGVYGRPEVLGEIYHEILPGVGVEAICWRHHLKHLREWKLSDYEIRGLHGAIRLAGGARSNVLAMVLDRLVIGNKESGEILGRFPAAYYLVHERCVDGYLVERSNGNERLLFVENEKYPGSLERAKVEVGKLRDRGVNAGLMIDLFHLTWDLGVKRRLDKVIEETRKVLDGLVPTIGFHFPVGSREDDSFLLNEISDETLKMLGEIFRNEKVAFVVLENQQRGGGMIFPRVALARERTKGVVGRLKELRVI